MKSKNEFIEYVKELGLSYGIVIIKSKVVLLEVGNDVDNIIDYVLFEHLGRKYKVIYTKMYDITNEYYDLDLSKVKGGE